MSKLRLSTEQMTSISNVWLTESRGTIEAMPSTAALLPDIEATHGDLVIARDTPPPVYALDLTHDRYFRCGYRLIQAQEALAVALEHKDEEARLEALEKLLYPHGLLGTTLSYEEQEGAALLLERSLTDEVKKRLQSISMTMESGETVHLLAMVEEHTAAAKELGIAERQKKKLQEQESSSSVPSAIDERKARLAWIQVANTLESVVALAVKRKTLPPEAAKVIVGALEEAEAEADRQYEDKKSKK
jgi:hypothetical protein